MRGLNPGIKAALGPTQTLRILQRKDGCTITDKAAKLNVWIYRYSELYGEVGNASFPNIATEITAPVMDQLDDEPLIEEVSLILSNLESHKAASKDGRPGKLLRAGSSVLTQHIRKLSLLC